MATDEISIPQFQEALDKYLKTHKPIDLTEHLDVTVPIVERWANRISVPVPAYRKLVVERIAGILAQENQKPQQITKTDKRNRGPQS